MTGGAASKWDGTCCFGDFELDFARQTLSRRGIRLKLQKQPWQVLALLVERAPLVVSRDEIRRRVWGENVYIDVEPNINFCIRQIRGVLLEEAAHPRYIETVPREGYRFLAALTGSVSSADLPTDQTDLSEAPADLNKTPIEVASVKPGISRWLMAAIALAALMLVGVVHG
jgi:DNA-binding winged helix-turn-helix (wHTH) protein